MLQVAAMASPDMKTINVLAVVVLVVLQVKPRLEVIKAFRTKVAPSWNYHCFLPKNAHRRAALWSPQQQCLHDVCALCQGAKSVMSTKISNYNDDLLYITLDMYVALFIMYMYVGAIYCVTIYFDNC